MNKTKKYCGGDIRQQYQGDISFIKIEKTDAQFSPLPKTGLILAEGETTGHKHLLVADKDSVVEISQDRNGYFINVKSGSATITHEEHEAQKLFEGIYFSGRQWEYNDLEERVISD